VEFSNFKNVKTFRSNFKVILIIAAVSLTILLSFSQAGYAAVIHCPSTGLCNGTSGDDIIFGGDAYGSIVHGLGGNDYIIGSLQNNFNTLYGDDGNDILIGGPANDFMNGGRGNDKYDAWFGDDQIWEDDAMEGKTGTLVNNDDFIAGGWGNDFIKGGEGNDKILGGPDNDYIFANGYYPRDFSPDFINCGLGADTIGFFNPGEGEVQVNCEAIQYDLDR